MWVLLGVGWVLYLTLTVGKPLHIDDTHYVASARHLLAEPGCPLCNEVNWKTHLEPTYRDNNNPPFYLYLMAGWMRIFGPAVGGLHVLASLMALAAAAGGWWLARRFTTRPGLATALVMTSPAVLPGGNLMLDVPVFALGTCALAAFVHGADRDRLRWLVGGALLASAALLTKYTAVVLLPVMAAYLLLQGPRRRLWVLSLPLLAFLAWCLHNLATFGELHVLVSAGAHGQSRVDPLAWWMAAASIAVAFGSSFLVPAVVVGLGGRLRTQSTATAAAAVALVALAVLVPPPPIYFLFAANALLLAGVAVRGRTAAGADRDGLWLGLAVLAVVGLHLVVARHQTPRYHLLAFFPFALLVVRGLAATGSRRVFRLAWAGVALQCVVTLAVAAADLAHARADAHLPAELLRVTGADPADAYCVGHWGWQAACEAAGVPTLDWLRHRLDAGDVLLVPRRSSLENLPPPLRELPHGRSLCPGSTPALEPLTELRGASPVEATDVGGRILARIGRWLPTSLMDDAELTSYYSAAYPAMPYRLRAPWREPPPPQVALAARVRCTVELAGERAVVELGSATPELALGSGWGLEHAGARWSVGERSRVSIFLRPAPGSYHLTFARRVGWDPRAVPVRVEARVEGTSLGVETLPPDQENASWWVPPGTLESGYNRVELVHLDAFVPARELTWSHDTRRVGLPYTRLVLEPWTERVEMLAARDADAALRLAGFSPAERTAERAWVWSVGERSAVAFFLVPSPRDRRLVLRGTPFGPLGAVAVDVAVDGVAIGEATIAPGGEEVQLAIPAGALRRGRVILTLGYDRTLAPASLDPASPDDRELAVAWEAMRVE